MMPQWGCATAKATCRDAVGAAQLRSGGRIGVALLVSLGIAACDFEVTNPGPVQDTFLNEPSAFVAVVNGAVRSLNEGLNFVAFHGAAVTRELHPTGQTGQFGIEPRNSLGILDPNEQGAPWANTHRGRWLAEDGLRRFQEVLPPTDFERNRFVAQGYLWAGFANRMLGENMCAAVFDKGPEQPRADYLTRAEEQLTRAIQVGTAAGEAATVQAARAARAAVRVTLGNWAGAVADAAAIPDDFVIRMPYFAVGNEFQFNRIAHAGANQPYKAHTVWGTPYETYFAETGDPRTAYEITGQVGTGALDCCGSVPFYRQLKYSRATGIDLATGTEMRLIEAEALLRDGNWQAGLARINQVRTLAGVDPWEVTGLEATWTALKRERGVDLWMEGRRLNDLRRWQADGTPGTLDPREVPGSASNLTQQDLCFPISQAERDTNPNLS